MRRVGIGTRVLNFVIDTTIIFLLSYAAFRGWRWYAVYYSAFFIPFYYFFWSFLIVYYIFFEAIFQRTPGKWVSLTKVVNEKRGKPSFAQIVIRSLVRLIIIDCFFIPFLNDRTLHDYLSKTEVVEI